MNYRFLDKINLFNNVEFKNDNPHVPFWRDVFDDDSRLKRICWHYRAYDIDFIVEQHGSEAPYQWTAEEYSGVSPTLKDARSAARNALRSALVAEARRRYRQAVENSKKGN